MSDLPDEAPPLVDPPLFDLGQETVLIRRSRDTLLVDGPDRIAWLNGVVTCNVEPLKSGSGAAYGLVLNRTGKIQSDVWCLESGGRLYLSVAPGTAAGLLQHLGAMLVMEDAEISDGTADWSWSLLCGPRSLALARKITESFKGVAAELDLTGLGDAIMALPHPINDDVLSFGAPELMTPEEWIALRLEQQLPEFGTDYDTGARPHEAALDRRAVSWNKGCYLGQEVVCMQDMRGKVHRRLVVLAAEQPFTELPPSGSAVLVTANGTPAKAERVAGKTKSAANSLRLARGLVMASVETAALSEPLAVQTPHGVVPVSPLQSD